LPHSGRTFDTLRGRNAGGVRFRHAPLAFDIVTVVFIIATSFLPSNDFTEALDVVLVSSFADFAADRQPAPTALVHPLFDLTDVIAIISFLARHREAGGFAYPHVAAVGDYQMLARLREDSMFFQRNEEVSSPSPTSPCSSS
jgi:voltage-gated potassium channel